VSPYLSVCAIYRDEGPYLREWVEFHRLVGVEHFFLYNNGSLDSDSHREALEPYIADGSVTARDWEIFPGQLPAYEDCLREHRGDSRWIAFIDIDEFVFSPSGERLPDILARYEECPGIGVERADFGTSGHRTRPPGLVIENYLRRGKFPDPNKKTNYKVIIDPTRVARCSGFGDFFYQDPTAAEGEGGRRPIYSLLVEKRLPIPELRMNHYNTKSELEWRRKLQKPQAWEGETRVVRQRGFEHVVAALDQETDETITTYLPALREALAKTEERAALHRPSGVHS
jgi:hypothetical protein